MLLVARACCALALALAAALTWTVVRWGRRNGNVRTPASANLTIRVAIELRLSTSELPCQDANAWGEVAHVEGAAIRIMVVTSRMPHMTHAAQAVSANGKHVHAAFYGAGPTHEGDPRVMLVITCASHRPVHHSSTHVANNITLNVEVYGLGCKLKSADVALVSAGVTRRVCTAKGEPLVTVDPAACTRPRTKQYGKHKPFANKEEL